MFSGRTSPLPDGVATLVLAQGRAPVDELWAELESLPHAVRAGDVLGPRTLEEAVLEGTRAVLDPPHDWPTRAREPPGVPAPRAVAEAAAADR